MSVRSQLAFFGVLIVVGGALVYRHARVWARLKEQEDAIGSTTDLADVEPAPWRVTLTKIGAAIVVVVGLGTLVLAVAPE